MLLKSVLEFTSQEWNIYKTVKIKCYINGNEECTPYSPEVELHHQMQFSVIPKTMLIKMFITAHLLSIMNMFYIDRYSDGHLNKYIPFR